MENLKVKSFSSFTEKERILNRLNLKGHFDYLNQNTLKLLGYENVEDLKKIHFKELINNINKEDKISEILQYMSNNNEWTGFLKIKRFNFDKNKEFVWAKVIISPFMYNGEKYGYTLIFEKPNIEDIKREEEKGN